MSANQLPTILTSGAIARYPLARLGKYSTRIAQMADFSEQRFQQLSNRLMSWDITLSMLTDQEFSDLMDFFDSQAGSFGTFTFVDPYDNLLQYSEEFENPLWAKQECVIGQNYLLNSQDFELAPWGGSNNGASNPVVTADNQTAPDGTLTADTIAFPAIPNTAGDFSQFLQIVAPPLVPGMTFTFSFWMKASSNVTIGAALQDNPFQEAHGGNVSVTTSWQRFSITGTFSGSAHSSIAVGFSVGQNSAAITVFVWGAQLEYGGAASDYTATTNATAPLEIADPFFIQAPATVPGFQWNLNSLFPRRGRQLVITNSSSPVLAQNLDISAGGTGNARTKGMTFSWSLYAKKQDTNPPSLPLALSDVQFYESAAQTLSPASAWTRISDTKTFTASNPASGMTFNIGGVGASGVGALYIFGAQVEAEGTVSAYKKTRAAGGVHTKCHFWADEIAHLASEFNVNVFENSMRTRLGGSRLSDVLSIYETA